MADKNYFYTTDLDGNVIKNTDEVSSDKYETESVSVDSETRDSESTTKIIHSSSSRIVINMGTKDKQNDVSEKIVSKDIIANEKTAESSHFVSAVDDKAPKESYEETKTTETVKFCVHCGEKVREGSAFCTACGEPVGGKKTEKLESNVYSTVQGFGSSQSKGKYIKIAAIVVVLAVLMLFVPKMTTSYKTPVDNLFKGVGQGNINKVKKAFYPGQVSNPYAQDLFDSLERDLKENSVRISNYKIIEKSETSEYDIEDIEEVLGISVSQAFDLEVQYMENGNGPYTQDITVFKCNKGWYIDPYYMLGM